MAVGIGPAQVQTRKDPIAETGEVNTGPISKQKAKCNWYLLRKENLVFFQ